MSRAAGFAGLFRRGVPKALIRCGMCGRNGPEPAPDAGRFIRHECGADLLLRARDPAAEPAALDLFVRAAGRSSAPAAEREGARDRLLYQLGEGPIPGLEDLLFRLKYGHEPFPPPEIAVRKDPADDQPALDWSNELEMFLHRMKKYAITRRLVAEAPESVRPILQDKLERLQTEPLEPIED